MGYMHFDMYYVKLHLTTFFVKEFCDDGDIVAAISSKSFLYCMRLTNVLRQRNNWVGFSTDWIPFLSSLHHYQSFMCCSYEV